MGAGVDGAVRRISTSYTVTGQVDTITSRDNAIVGSVNGVNEVHLHKDNKHRNDKKYNNIDGLRVYHPKFSDKQPTVINVAGELRGPEVIFTEYVHIGVIRTNGIIVTVFPDADQQP